MTIKYKIIEDLKLVYVSTDGTLSFDDLMKHIVKLSEDPKYKPPMLKLVNYSNLEKYLLKTEEAEIFSQKKASLTERFLNEKCAFVVSSNLVYGMARHHQAYIDKNKIDTNIFRDLEEATKWLGIDIKDEDLIID
jgi:hypothetical protein